MYLFVTEKKTVRQKTTKISIWGFSDLDSPIFFSKRRDYEIFQVNKVLSCLLTENTSKILTTTVVPSGQSRNSRSLDRD